MTTATENILNYSLSGFILPLVFMAVFLCRQEAMKRNSGNRYNHDK